MSELSAGCGDTVWCMLLVTQARHVREPSWNEIEAVVTAALAIRFPTADSDSETDNGLL